MVLALQLRGKTHCADFSLGYRGVSILYGHIIHLTPGYSIEMLAEGSPNRQEGQINTVHILQVSISLYPCELACDMLYF